MSYVSKLTSANNILEISNNDNCGSHKSTAWITACKHKIRIVKNVWSGVQHCLLQDSISLLPSWNKIWINYDQDSYESVSFHCHCHHTVGLHEHFNADPTLSSEISISIIIMMHVIFFPGVVLLSGNEEHVTTMKGRNRGTCVGEQATE